MSEHVVGAAFELRGHTVSHHEERSTGLGSLHAPETAFVGTTLGARFAKALADLEGLLYVVCGSVPDSYESGRQWWHHDNPRCLWPEQVRRWECGPQARNELAYSQTAAMGERRDWRGEPAAAVDTGYFDWSRSDTMLRQWWRTSHDAEFFPPGSVSREADGVSEGHPDYGDPRSSSEVRISYTAPESVRGRIVGATLEASPGGAYAMTHDGAGTWRATLPRRAHGTAVSWYIRLNLSGPDETIYEPCGATRTQPPTMAGPHEDEEGVMPGSGHGLQQAGESYYYRHFDHRHPYMHGLPELLWKYLPAEQQVLRKCSGTWQFEPWTNVRPGLINLARFALDWIGARFHHDPRYRGAENGCCMPATIRWRWSGSNRPWLYRAGGKSGVHPLHNHPLENPSGNEEARRTWRGMPAAFFHLEGEAQHMAGYLQAPRYGWDESWLSWPEWADFACQNEETEYWYPGWMNEHGEDRGLREGDVIDPVHLEEIIAAVEYLKSNGLWFVVDVNTTKRTPPDCRPLLPNDRMGTGKLEWSCRCGNAGQPVCVDASNAPTGEVVGRSYGYNCGFDCGPWHGLYGTYFGPNNEACWNDMTWSADCPPPDGTEWDHWWKIVPWSAPTSQACCNAPHPSRCPYWEYTDPIYGLIHTDLVEAGKCYKGLSVRRTCMGRSVSACSCDGVEYRATETDRKCLAAFSNDPDYAELVCEYEPGFEGDPRGITCTYTAQTIGWHGYVCAPKRQQCPPGSGTWGNGAPRWTHDDAEHGNGLAGVGCLTKSRLSCRYLADGLETPEGVPSMGNAPRKGSRALMCATRADGQVVSEIPFADDPQAGPYIAAVDWAGPAVAWVTGGPSCSPERPIAAGPGVIPPLPGLGDYGPWINGVRVPVCSYENYSEGLLISRAYCTLDKSWFPLCDGTKAYAAVDLNLNGNGVPRLKDYDLTIRGLDANGGPLMQAGRAVCPDTPNWSDERRLPWGGVRCPCHTGPRRAKDRGIWDD